MSVIEAAATPGVLAKHQHRVRGKTPEKSRPSGLVSAKMQHQDDVDQWCGTIEEMNMIEHQSLYQQEYYKQHKSSYLFYTH